MLPASEIARRKLRAAIVDVPALEESVPEPAQVGFIVVALLVREVLVDLGLDVRARRGNQFGDRGHHRAVESFSIDLDVSQTRQRLRSVRAEIRREVAAL